jgi:hypothetical protein
LQEHDPVTMPCHPAARAGPTREAPETPRPVPVRHWSAAQLAALDVWGSGKVPEICDRTALTSGDSLGRLARRKFGAKARTLIGLLLIALLLANGLNVAADLMAIGQGMALLHAGPAGV